MDDITEPTITAPASSPSSSDPTTATPTPQSDLASELAHVTKEMYKKNLEMAEKNKTLSLLRRIDEIILSSVTDPRDVAQKVVNVVVEEADVKVASILLLDRKNQALVKFAVSQTEPIMRAELEYNKSYHGDKLPLAQTENLLVKAVVEHAVQSTDILYQVLKPTFTEAEAQNIQQILGITKSWVYPLIIRQDILGVMVVDIGEKDELLSEYQKDLIDRLAGVVGIAIDNALLYLNIRLANERLKELDKMKDEFVSLASHELRTPMTAIKSYLSMIRDNNMVQDPKGSEYIAHAYDVTDRLINLVNDMLNVSRIESGRMILTFTPVELPSLITDVIAEVNPVAEKQGISLEANLEHTSLPPINADANKLKEVFMNLIGNSLKFTPSGGKITILAREEGDVIAVSITDTGKGIRQEDIPKLFTKFGMIEKNYGPNHSSQGTGLGLYICKSIVELHGGKISVISGGENQGTTFTFTLKPATEVPQPLQQQA